MAKEEFKYKGKTVEELKEMSLSEFAELLPSKKRRSLKRGFTHEQKSLLEKLEKKDSVKTHARDMIIIPSMIGKKVRVYSGQNFIPIEIEPEMVSHRLGEFIQTRKRVEHSGVGISASDAEVRK